MLKRLRNLRDEIDAVKADLETYPDPEETLPGAGSTESYTKSLGQVSDNLSSLIKKIEGAGDKVADEQRERASTPEGREELRAEAADAAAVTDTSQGDETSEGGRVTATQSTPKQDKADKK